MAGKKRGKKGKSQDTEGQPSNSQQQGNSEGQHLPVQHPQQVPHDFSHQRPLGGSEGQQQPRDSQAQQLLRGLEGHQQQQSFPSQQSPRRPKGQQQHRGPEGQQQQQQHRGPEGQQQQQQQHWGPEGQQQQQQQHRGLQTQQQRGSKQGSQGQQKPQNPQRGGGQRRPQQGKQKELSQQQTISSTAPLVKGAVAQISSQVSKMQLSKTHAGQGDSEFGPMESQIPIKPGTKGRKIMVETNHLPLNLGKLKTAVHYDVNLVPDTPKRFLRTVLEAFRKKHYGQCFPAFDGRKNLYSSQRLPFGDFIADEIAIQDSEGREKKFKVEIKFANNVDLTPLHDLMNSKQTPREAMQVVDIVLRSAPAATFIPVGRSFFCKPRSIIDLGEGMEMYNGFFQSAVRGWKPFLNIDVAHKAFPKDMNLIDILPELFNSHYQPFRREDLAKELSRYQQETLQKFIKTLRVSYEIPNHPTMRKAYRVNGIGKPPRDSVFKLDGGEQTTIEKYFEKNKQYRLRYPHLPTLWVGAPQRQNKILLPLELCSLEQGQAIPRKMTENQTSNMIKYAATSTTVRKDKIMTALHQANYNTHPTIKEFGFSIGNEFEKLKARILEPPALEYGEKISVSPSKGVWRGKAFFSGVTINKWTIACADKRAPPPFKLAELADMIFKNATASGMAITSQAEKPFDHIGQTIHDIRKYFQIKKEKKYDIIFIIVPNNGPQYSYVKTVAEINVGCLTQCIKSRTLMKMNVQTVVNILLKVNSKLNGINHILLTRPPIMHEPCIVMGADVTHPSPDAKDIPSVAAITACHDLDAFQYNICWRLQPPKVEIIEDLEAVVMEQLKYYYQKTGEKPRKILFFRDGVSEGQFEQVRNAEIRAIRSACKRLQADGYEPSITFLVVQKRHHTRLFPTNRRDSEDKNFNVPAGTCVDTTITHPFMQDFYLVSHASIQGVARPTKYCTLWDDNDMSNDDIEELTYYLCHMFSRCTRSVSYPAPTYYAHLAAARAKVYIENDKLNMNQLQRECARFKIQDGIRKDLPMFFV